MWRRSGGQQGAGVAATGGRQGGGTTVTRKRNGGVGVNGEDNVKRKRRRSL
ncbi:unnamed protein product [Spirodela intermedia]|uniref:Uncharacterized protein n=1 Tax=Spirodela intermedia TaxID=51605 RepID=A0ABN7ECJ6_SPIIN|nr:unnamed protein product [Spirodela intermedia]